MNTPEFKIQSEIVKWYNNNFCLKHHEPRGIIFSVPNELAGSNKIATARAKTTGLMSGVSDLVIIKPDGELVFTECKNETGKQTPAQKDFENTVTALGFRYIVVRSLDEFKSLI